MALTIKEFWKLAIESRVLALDECKNLHAAFARVPGAAKQGNAVTLSEWLIAGGVLNRYQTKLLLAGRPGPFFFGDYKVYDKLDSGRLAGMYKAVHAKSGHPVLLHFLSGQATQDPEQWERVVERTAEAAAAANPHLSRVYELVDLDDYKFLVFEDLNGQTFAERFRGARVAAAEACRLLRQAAVGLARLHELGQAHGEIRTSNLWTENSGDVKLLQFPLCRNPLAPAELDLAAADYLAPEVGRSGRTPDALSDVYSLGCVFYELLSGRVPFPAGDVAHKIQRHATEPIESLEQTAGVPGPLAQLVTYMMAKNPRLRYQGGAMVADALAGFVQPADLRQRATPARSLDAFERMLKPAGGNGAAPAGGGAMKTTPSGPQIVTSGGGPAGAKIAASKITESLGASPGLSGPLVGAAAGKPSGGIRLQTAGAQPIAEKPGANGALGTRKKKRSSTTVIAFGATGTIAIVLAIVAIVMSSGETPTVATKKPGANKKTQPDQRLGNLKPVEKPATDPAHTLANVLGPKKPPRTKPERPPVQEVEDDGETLWVSPTHGEPLKLAYLPPGAQVFLALRPADLLASPEGARMFKALGPAGEQALGDLQAIVGQPLAQVEQLVVALYPNDADPPKEAFWVRLSAAKTEAELLEAWKNPTPAETAVTKKKYFKGPAWAYFPFPQEALREFTIAAPAEMEEACDTETPPLSNAMEKMLRDTDAQRHFTVLAAPNNLYSSAKGMFVGDLDKLRKPLNWFLGDNARAALLSFQLGEDFFIELRAFGTLDEDAYALATNYRQRLGEVPEYVDQYLQAAALQPYGKAILLRFPQMIRMLQDYSRVGEEDKQAVLRCYLPGSAGHNLLMGTELALFEKPGAGAAASVAVSKTPSGPKEALQKKISLSFPRDTLEKSMDMISKEIETEIIILGSDLQLEGITKNQSFALDEREKPAGEILQKIMSLANPDGKLVYVFKPKAAGEKDVIFVTTRASAQKRGDKLPPELAKEEPKKP